MEDDPGMVDDDPGMFDVLDLLMPGLGLLTKAAPPVRPHLGCRIGVIATKGAINLPCRVARCAFRTRFGYPDSVLHSQTILICSPLIAQHLPPFTDSALRQLSLDFLVCRFSM